MSSSRIVRSVFIYQCVPRSDDISYEVVVALNFTSLAGNGPLPTDHIPDNQVCIFGLLLFGTCYKLNSLVPCTDMVHQPNFSVCVQACRAGSSLSSVFSCAHAYSLDPQRRSSSSDWCQRVRGQQGWPLSIGRLYQRDAGTHWTDRLCLRLPRKLHYPGSGLYCERPATCECQSPGVGQLKICAGRGGGREHS